MKVFVNEEGKIKAVHTSDDTSLQTYELDEEHASYPFAGWSDGRIMCYRINVSPITIDEELTGKYMVTMMTPYVDTIIIEKIEDLYTENGALRSSQIETEQTITDVDLQMIENEQMITDMDLRLMTLEG